MYPSPTSLAQADDKRNNNKRQINEGREFTQFHTVNLFK
jgi:hypothetical protein